jgi:SAM-dependent methyltransferase
MTDCRYCHTATRLLANLEIPGVARSEMRECPACTLTAIYPFPPGRVVESLRRRRREQFPAFDDNFEWKLFVVRRYFDNGFKVLSIGTDCPLLAAAFRKEDLQLRQMPTADVRALAGLAAGEFDAVFIWDELGFLEDIRGVLRQVKRVLKQDGYVSLRVRDAWSRRNRGQGAVNLTKGDGNLLGRHFIRRLYQDYFDCVPHCFLQEAYDDSVLIALGRAGSGANKDPSLYVLFLVHPFLFSKLDDATGPRGRVLNTIDMLARAGIQADVSLSLTPEAAGYDLAHLFHNAWETQDALSQMLAVQADDARVVISTIYMDPSETNFVINTINDIFKIHSREEREAYLQGLAQGGLRAGPLTQGGRFYARWQIEEDQRALLELADRLICFSHAEMRQMSLNLNRTRPFSLVYNAADDETFGAHGPETFVEDYGVRDFVISVGHVEWRKNQLMLLYALRDCPDIPVVIVGARTDDEYYELCRLWAHKNTRFIPQLKHRRLAGALAAARVHAQPSWIEGISLSAIEAAMCGCTPVVCDRAGEIEYYGPLGYYVNPGSVESIRRGVLAAYHGHTPALRAQTRELVRSRYTFKKAVEMTIDAYHQTLGRGVG